MDSVCELCTAASLWLHKLFLLVNLFLRILLQHGKIFYFSVNTELIEIILFKTAYRVHFFPD